MHSDPGNLLFQGADYRESHLWLQSSWQKAARVLQHHLTFLISFDKKIMKGVSYVLGDRP